MPFNSGTFSPTYNWSNEAAAGNPPASAKFTAQDADFASGLSTAILKDGTQTVTADIPFNGHKITGLGAATNAGDAISISVGTFTATGTTGWTTTPSVTCHYAVLGKMVILSLPAISGTSNSGSAVVTGMPAALFPTRTQFGCCTVTNNASIVQGVWTVDTSGNISFELSNLAAFTSSGLKNTPQVETSITYLLT